MKPFLSPFFIALQIVFIACCCTEVQAQNYLQDPMVFSPTMGFPHKSIRVFAQDKNEITWLGTRRGFCRFDGHTFETFLHNPNDPNSISNNDITALCPDPITGNIWIGHKGGLSVYFPDQKIFKNYFPDKESPASFPVDKVSSILVDEQGEVWIGVSHYGLYQYQPFADHFIRIEASEHQSMPDKRLYYKPEKILQDDQDQNRLWLISSRGLAYLDKKEMIVTFVKQHLKSENRDLSSKRAISFCQLPNGKLYVSFRKEGLIIFDKKSQEFIRPKDCGEAKISDLKTEFGVDLRSYSDHEFWISSKLGAYLYNAKSDCISFAKHSTKYVHQKYYVDYVDPKKRIWSRARNQNFHIFNPELQQEFNFKEFDFHPFSSANPRKILIDTLGKKQYLLFGKARGIYVADLYSDNWEIIPPPTTYAKKQKKGFPGHDMALLNDGSLFIITRREAFIYQQGFKTLKEYPLKIENKMSNSFGMTRVIQGQDGTLWITGINKVYNLTLGDDHLINASKNKEGKWIKGSKLAQDKNGNIYLPGRKTLQVILKEENRIFRYGYREEIKNAKDHSICVDNTGDIWFTLAEKYLVYVDTKKEKKKITAYYGEKEGLDCRDVYAIVPYKNQLVLLSKTGAQVFDIEKKKLSQSFNFHKTSSDPIGDATVHPDGRILAITKKGLLSFRFEALKNSEAVLRPYLSGFKVLGSETVYPIFYDHPQIKLLKHDENFFSFKFSALGYDYPEKTKFKYQLKGVDKNWIEGTPGEFIRYTDVPSGDYDFWVEAFNSSAESSGPKLIAKVNISTPWWKTMWFRGLVLASLLLMGFLFYKNRVARIRKEEQQKSEVQKLVAEAEMAALRAQMNPHFIFNSLNSIDYYIIKQDQETASDYLNRFSRLIRLVLQNSKSDKVPLKNDLEAVQLYIELESLRFSKKFEYDISIDPNIDLQNTIIPPMLIQPYVENAIWHGLMQQKDKTGFLLLSLHLEEDFLICQIKDNGIGRAAAMALKSKSGSQRKSFGMKITSDRLELLNAMEKAKAEVLITDLKNIDGSPAGTRVELKIPVEKLKT